MAFDAHKNFAYSQVGTAPSPASSGTSLTVGAGNGALFPAVPFNATVWPPNVQPSATNAEIVRVTNIVGDVFTITRAQEGTAAIAIGVNYQIAETVTAKVFTDIETPVTTIVASTPQNPPNDISKFLRGDSPATWSRIQNVVVTTSTGTVNNFAPGLVAGAVNVVRCNNATDLILTGLSATGITDGTLVIFQSIGAGNVYFKHLNGGSSAANQFTNIATSADTPISKGCAIFFYDLTSTTWRLFQHEQGDWITPLSTSFGGMSLGTLITNKYYLRGRDLDFDFAVATMAVTGGAAAITVTLCGFTAQGRQGIQVCRVSDNGGAAAYGMAVIGSATASVSFYKDASEASNWTASAGSTSIEATVKARVQ